MKRVTLKEAKEMATRLNIDLQVIDLHTLRDGIEVEMEHGLVTKKLNVTNNDLVKTT